MNNESQNRQLHLALGRGCWHDVQESVGGVWLCLRCGFVPTYAGPDNHNPAYCSDLNLCAEAGRAVIEKVGGGRWVAKLQYVVQNRADTTSQTLYVPAASAPDRVAAMLMALEGE